VAIVAGKTLTFEMFCRAAHQHAVPHLLSSGSIERRILLQVVDERIVAMEAEALEVAVTSDDLRQRYREWDQPIKDKSNGMRTLDDLMRERRTTAQEFWSQMRHQLTLERVANHRIYLNGKLSKHRGKRLGEIALVLEQLRKQSVVEIGGALADPVPRHWRRNVKLENGDWAATVKNAKNSPIAPRTITKIQYGEQLILRLSSGAVREILDRECKTALMASGELSLTKAQFDEEVEVQKKIWLLERQLTSTEAWRSLSYEEFVKVKYQLPLEAMRENRYYRGHYGLLRRFRNTTNTPDAEVNKAYEEKRDTTWGPYILVTDIAIGFAQKKGPFGSRSGRLRKEAVRLARQVPQQIAKGVPFSQVVSTINAKKDPTFKAERRRLRATKSDPKRGGLAPDQILFERVSAMKDGQLSGIIDTLSDVHLLKRESAHPAPKRADVLPLVREGIARRKARTWLGDKLLDTSVVRIRWPLPQRGGAKAKKN